MIYRRSHNLLVLAKSEKIQILGRRLFKPTTHLEIARDQILGSTYPLHFFKMTGKITSIEYTRF